MQAFELADIELDRKNLEKSYLEFLRENSLSMGLYTLQAGEGDSQKPHTEDEVYVIVDGSGQIEVAGENRDVTIGTIVYVPANEEHRFHSITEDLSALVFFAPSEYTNVLNGPEE